MKIVHLCLSGPYTENWAYQENLLPLYQRKLGHEVTVIATDRKHGVEGRIEQAEVGERVLDDGIRLIRVASRSLVTKRVGHAYGYFGVLRTLVRLRPDFIMLHGLVSVTALQAILFRMAFQRRCVLVADTHLDSYNAPVGRGWLPSRCYRKSIACLARFYASQCKVVYGITPDCIRYAVRTFGLREETLSLLPLGADTDGIDFDQQEVTRKEVRESYGIPMSHRVIVTGGKLDAAKNVLNLIESVDSPVFSDVTLVVFGGVGEDIREDFARAVKNGGRVRFVGFLSREDIGRLYLASDVAVFAGTQSALWQQAIASGLPAVFRWWPGIDYLDLGGNCVFLHDSSVDGIRRILEQLLVAPHRLIKMSEVARTLGYSTFSYRSLAEEVLSAVER